MRVRLFTTGGTIDGANLVTRASRPESDAARWLSRRNDLELTVVPILNKDSRTIDDADRQTIAHAVASAPESHILITHGTFTMPETGRVLQRTLAGSGKTVVLVGAWVPLHEPASDAPQQLELALAALRDSPPGVYIAMDGRLHDPANTEKSEVEGKSRFIERPG